MQTIFKKWNCWGISSSERYIAAFGAGITILNRSTLEIVHHFTRIRYVIGGYFLCDDVLVVFTSEQRILFFQISKKQLSWECPRPKELASSGDIRWAATPDGENVICIAAGRQSLNEHFYLSINYEHRTIVTRRIPNCYRVVSSIVQISSLGPVCLSYEADGTGKLQYNMIVLKEDGNFLTLCNWNSNQTLNFCSGNYLFMNDYTNQEPQLWKYRLNIKSDCREILLEDSVQIPVPTEYTRGPVGTSRPILPSISWVDEETGLLIINSSNWIGVIDFLNEHPIAEYEAGEIAYGTIVDKNLLIGCTPGLYLEKLPNVSE